jgi:phosphotransferase system, enzyme I, PtsP
MTTLETSPRPDSESWVGTRDLLRRLREIMQDAGAIQERLNRIVTLIAGYLSAEVCSIYATVDGLALELRATKGLRPEAVRRTRLRVGEGLVGDIAAHARPLALAEAQSHPNFAYRPETGEEIYHSFLGVPVMRGGKVMGVLVVQNVISRSYSSADVEICETVAMVLAELIDRMLAAETGGGVPDPMPVRLVGSPLNSGIGIGTAMFHQKGIVISRVVADDPKRETARLREALGTVERLVSTLLAARQPEAGRDDQEVLETYLMLVGDRGWRARIEDAILSGLTAEAAVQKVQIDTRARMLNVKDRYLRERLSDFEDLTSRLLRQLLGDDGLETGTEPPPDAILVARDLGPAELLDYDRFGLRAVLLADGSPTAHATIVARALDIPMIGHCPEVLTQIRDGDCVIVNGDLGQVLVRPNQSVRAEFANNIAARAEQSARFKALRHLPAVSTDGIEVSLNANAGLLIDLPQVRDSGAEGIGLYRTEVAFMVREKLPDVAAQTTLYTRVLDEMGDKPVVFRTLDIGGDKLLPYFDLEGDEVNPAMGWRAIRIALDRPELLRDQLRAMLQAAAGKDLRVVFPMIAEVAEFDAARVILDEELEDLHAAHRDGPREVKVGAMLEVPALLWQLPALFDRVDFLSIGSNDLFQFVFASDRANPRLSERYDTLSPAALKLLSQVASQADAAHVPVTLCGEMAGKPLEAMAAIGCGIRRLSMAPAKVPPVKAMVRSLDLGDLRRALPDLLERAGRSVRDDFRHYARDREVDV